MTGNVSVIPKPRLSAPNTPSLSDLYINAPLSPSDLSRFHRLAPGFDLDATIDPDRCVYWTGHRNQEGRARFQLRPSFPVVAPRFAYRALFGPIPPGSLVLHACGNGHLGCCRGSHLYLADAKRNALDAYLDGTAPGARLHTVTTARFMHHNLGLSYKTIADALGLSATSVGRMCRGETHNRLSWPSGVPQPQPRVKL